MPCSGPACAARPLHTRPTVRTKSHAPRGERGRTVNIDYALRRERWFTVTVVA